MQIAIAPLGLEEILSDELGNRSFEQHGRLFIIHDERPVHWAQNVWLNVQQFSFTSISEAAKHLRSIQRNWHLHSVSHHRRAQLIKEQLPPLKVRELEFPTALPSARLGSWTLLDTNTVAYSGQCSSLFGDGEIFFKENKTDPPSRAYLKLWEAFTLLQKWPSHREKVVDLGSSPGGWTWVLDQLGATVVSVDKAPLSEHLKLSSRVQVLAESAFALKPETLGKVDWLFSDIICYPERLLTLVQKWESHARNMICTIKFQGETDHSVVEKFLKIQDSQVVHLHHNKHELTWIRIKP